MEVNAAYFLSGYLQTERKFKELETLFERRISSRLEQIDKLNKRASGLRQGPYSRCAERNQRDERGRSLFNNPPLRRNAIIAMRRGILLVTICSIRHVSTVKEQDILPVIVPINNLLAIDVAPRIMICLTVPIGVRPVFLKIPCSSGRPTFSPVHPVVECN